MNNQEDTIANIRSITSKLHHLNDIVRQISGGITSLLNETREAQKAASESYLESLQLEPTVIHENDDSRKPLISRTFAECQNDVDESLRTKAPLEDFMIATMNNMCIPPIVENDE